MKFVLLFGLGCLPLISSLAGEIEGRLAVEEVVSSALAANPMLKASAAKWAAMKERVPQAKAWEDPMVGVDFERMGTTRFNTYSDAEWMASQSLPITGKNLSRGRAAEAEARATYEGVRREIEGERASALGMLRDQLRKITTARRQYELSRDKLLPLARQTTETLRINYQADTATFIEVLTVQRILRDAEAAASTQLTDYLAALAELEAIVGADPTEVAPPKTVVPPSKRRKP